MTPADDQLRRLIHDALEDIEPTSKLAGIKTAVGRSSAPRPRLGWLAVAAAAAVVVTFGLMTLPRADDPASVAGQEVTPTTSPPASSAGSTEAPSVPSPSPASGAMEMATVYFGVPSSRGMKLATESRPISGDPLTAAIREAVTADPADPDYVSLWPEGLNVARAQVDNTTGVIVVELTGALLDARPVGLTRAEARLALQQVVYTADDATGTDLPVRFASGGEPLSRVLGVPTWRPTGSRSELTVMNLVTIDSPAQGAVVTSDLLDLSGQASSNEGTVTIEIRQGDQVVLSDYATASGWLDGLYPWQTTVDISTLPPGDFTLVAKTAAVGEGWPPDEDTKDFQIAEP